MNRLVVRSATVPMKDAADVELESGYPYETYSGLR